jgi:hypothetical protein
MDPFTTNAGSSFTSDPPWQAANEEQREHALRQGTPPDRP